MMMVDFVSMRCVPPLAGSVSFEDGSSLLTLAVISRRFLLRICIHVYTLSAKHVESHAYVFYGLRAPLVAGYHSVDV